MKKQIFILVFLVMATFASVTVSYGQVALTPRTVTCLTADALHPIAGQPFNYTIDVPAIVGTKVYTWFVTQEPHFINAGVLTATREATTGSLLFATGAGYNDATGTNTVSLTWKSFVYNPAAPVFVVIQVQNTATTPDGCVTKNMKVFKINPANAFTLDIANLVTGLTAPVAGALDAGAYGANMNKCIHDIVDAIYDATAPEGVIYDYGTDYMFYEVVAANFNTSWKPTFTLTGVDVTEALVTVEWATDKNFTTPHALALAAGIYSSADVYTAVAVGGTVGAAGESIYVRVTLDHSTTVNYQGLTVQTVLLAVDGLTNLSAALPADYIGDVHYDNGPVAVPCAALVVDGYTNDIATQTLNPRPTIDAAVPATMPAPGLLPVKP